MYPFSHQKKKKEKKIIPRVEFQAKLADALLYIKCSALCLQLFFLVSAFCKGDPWDISGETIRSSAWVSQLNALSKC